jgi:hypothetical protein
MNPSTTRGPKPISIILAIALTAAALSLSLGLVEKKPGEIGLERATEMISSSVLLNRQKAVAGHTKYGIKYEEGAFRVYREEPTGTWMLDPPDNRYALPEDVRISSSSTPEDGWIVIHGTGEIDAGDLPVLLRLRDQQGHRASIRIMGSGRVQESSGW